MSGSRIAACLAWGVVGITVLMALPEIPRVISLLGEGGETAWSNAIENRYGYTLIIAPLFWYFMTRWGLRLWNMDTVYECRECRTEFESVREYEAHFKEQHDHSEAS